jgi:hypothetical protein
METDHRARAELGGKGFWSIRSATQLDLIVPDCSRVFAEDDTIVLSENPILRGMRVCFSLTDKVFDYRL